MYLEALILGGLAQGALIALGAIGVTLLFRVSKFANVALGDMMTVSAYCAYLGNQVVPGNFTIVTVVGMAAGATIGMLTYVICFSRRAKPLTYFITSIGVALVLRAIVMLVWGTNPYSYAGFYLNGRALQALPLSWASAVVIIACIIFGIMFFYVVMHTQAGRLVRAVADHPDLAKTNGVDVPKIILWVWAAAGAIAGLAGVLLGIGSQLNPDMGWNLLLETFAAAILGGFGNIRGAVFGGLLIGVITQLSFLVVPPQLTPAVALAIMIVVLLWRPTGLFREVTRV